MPQRAADGTPHILYGEFLRGECAQCRTLVLLCCAVCRCGQERQQALQILGGEVADFEPPLPLLAPRLDAYLRAEAARQALLCLTDEEVWLFLWLWRC